MGIPLSSIHTGGGHVTLSLVGRHGSFKGHAKI
jgi:hypothetical protein